MSGFYKGLIYCRGLSQAYKVKMSLDFHLKSTFKDKTSCHIKRGCSEFPLKFPEYGKINTNPTKVMEYPSKWKSIEEQFDQNDFIEPKENLMPSIPEFCLSDFYIIQKWIDYAKGLGDPSCKAFEHKPIIFPEVYDKAVLRKTKCNKVFV